MATVSLQATYDQARRLLESGDAERAVAVTQHILQTFPRNLEAQRLLGEAYLAGRHLEQAQSSFQTVLSSDPENIPAYVGLGITRERQGDLDQAIQAFEHALEIKPDMPELRSQLLRLYTETWGNEGAQLRLSRAGLARLYAKGHMLAQAVQEFRSVINDQPERLDARVALAEVLWREGQEDAAIAASEDILQDYPYALKPNLLLGYLYMAAGDPQGESYWNRSLELDPYQTIARTMFDQLPFTPTGQPTLPEWDEQAWQDSQQPVQQEEIKDDRTLVEPVIASTAAAASGLASSADDDFFGGSWMETIDQEQKGTDANELAGDDDFLQRLLAFDSLDSDVSAEIEVAPDADSDPFSIDDLAPMAEPFSFDTEPASPSQDNADVEEQELAPFSLADLGLSDDEIAQVQQDTAVERDETFSETLPETTESTLTPFSPAELGLDETEAEHVQQDDQEQVSDDLSLTPFSLSDLGLSDDEIAQFQAADEVQTQPAGQMSAVTAQNDVTLVEQSADEEPTLTPFSLSDLGLSDDEIAQFNQSEETSEPTAGLGDVKPFSLDDWNLDASATQLGDVDADDEGFELPDELQPFSLDDLDITSSGAQQNLDIGSLPPSLQPFSLDDVADVSPRTGPNNLDLPLRLPEDDETATTESGGYSFREAPARENTNFGRDQQQDDDGARPSIFSKLRQRHSELPHEEPPPLPPVSDDEMDMSLFGNDDISLRDDTAISAETTPEAVEPVSMPEPPTSDEPDLSPFSLSDLGLSPEEIASLGLEEPSVEQPTAFVDETINDLPVETAEAPTPQMAPVDDETDLTPFSLSDLGLSPEEIASLGLEEPSVEQPTAFVDETISDLPVETAEAPTPQMAPVEDETDLTPFSLSDLGLSPEEIASLGLGEADTSSVQPPADQSADPYATLNLDISDLQPSSPTSGEDDQTDMVFDFDMLGEQPTALTPKGQEEGFDDDIRPFSLDDLGLGDDDTASFDNLLGSELGLTEEELASMDLGALEQANTSPRQQPDEEEEQYQVDTGDSVLDQLITIGRRQGFVDLDDIIQAVENPEEESDRIEEIGLVLHRAGIQIRDGDEIIDMDEEGEEEYVMYAEEEPEETPPAVVSTEEPDLTPFSLSDLGLSPEEIASLGLEETGVASDTTQPETVETQEQFTPSSATTNEEPDLTPFSLSDLGLSPEEIASLGLEETSGLTESEPEASEPAEQPAPSIETTEPDMTPFSLDDLGLSPEEIASLGLEEATAEQSTPSHVTQETASTSDEPDLTPFSLSDLGLSPEEIASLGLEEASTAESASSAGGGGDELDTFDFSMVEEANNEPVVSTPRVRVEEPPPPESPEDAAFAPKALEELDAIWDAVPAQAMSEYVPPAVEPPAQPERAEPARNLPPASERIVRFERPQPVAETPAQAPREPERRAPEPVRAPERQSPSQPSAAGQPPIEQNRPARQQRPASWQLRQSPTAFIPTGDSTLDGYLLQLEAEPDNAPLRVAVARISGQTERFDLAVQQYKALIKSGNALDQITEDLEELVGDVDDRGALQKLYRLLGDAYTKQNRFRDAVEAYSWTFAKS